MRVAETEREHDCLRVCVASVFEVDVDAIPYVDASLDWPGAWQQVYEFVAGRGFHFAWQELDDSVPLVGYLDGFGETTVYWVASVLHPSFGGWAHALLFHGDECVVYPPTGRADVPFGKLELHAVGSFVAIDPAALQLVL